jgi:hypothetical protein
LTVWGVRTTFWDAAQDLGKLEGVVSQKHRERELGYQAAQKKRRDAATILNFWAPAYAKIWQKETGKTVSSTYISPD